MLGATLIRLTLAHRSYGAPFGGHTPQRFPVRLVFARRSHGACSGGGIPQRFPVRLMIFARQSYGAPSGGGSPSGSSSNRSSLVGATVPLLEAMLPKGLALALFLLALCCLSMKEEEVGVDSP